MLKPLTVCGSQQTVENSERDGNTRPPDLSPEKPVIGQEATVRIRHATMDWLKIGERVQQSYILSPCLFNLYAEYIMQNHKLELRILGEITSDMQVIPLSRKK